MDIHNETEIELCKRIGAGIFLGDGNSCGEKRCAYAYKEKDMCAELCKDRFKLLLREDVEKILLKYKDAGWINLNIDENSSCISFFLKNVSSKNTFIKESGKTSLEAGLKAILKIAEILNKKPSEL